MQWLNKTCVCCSRYVHNSQEIVGTGVSKILLQKSCSKEVEQQFIQSAMLEPSRTGPSEHEDVREMLHYWGVVIRQGVCEDNRSEKHAMCCKYVQIVKDNKSAVIICPSP
jgi:DNA-binding IclR family transcriptional regulator